MSTLLLFSGGIESTALAFWKRPDLLLHIDYGHLAAQGELRAARAIATRINLPLNELRADCSTIGSGALAGRPAALPAPASSWWPFRNQLLITLGAAFALNHGIDTLLLGSVASDRLYLDGTANFVNCLRELLGLQEGHICLEAPAISLTTNQLIQQSKIPCSLLAWGGITRSCV